MGLLLTSRENSLERALETAVSRALRDNLAPLQKTADELHQAYADLVAACASTRPSNALPAMLRAQTAAAALAAGLSVLSNFVAVALNPRDSEASQSSAASHSADVDVAEPEPEEAEAEEPESEEQGDEEFAFAPSAEVEEPEAPPASPAKAHVPAAAKPVVEEPAATEPQPFDIATLPAELQDLHRRANRVAKVAMQDIKLLRPKDVQTGREHKDLCNRLRADLDKARKEYDRRFRAISDHPVDYFHHWMLEILAGGDRAALGEYPYPSPLRQ